MAVIEKPAIRSRVVKSEVRKRASGTTPNPIDMASPEYKARLWFSGYHFTCAPCFWATEKLKMLGHIVQEAPGRYAAYRYRGKGDTAEDSSYFSALFFDTDTKARESLSNGHVCKGKRNA